MVPLNTPAPRRPLRLGLAVRLAFFALGCAFRVLGRAVRRRHCGQHHAPRGWRLSPLSSLTHAPHPFGSFGCFFGFFEPSSSASSFVIPRRQPRADHHRVGGRSAPPRAVVAIDRSSRAPPRTAADDDAGGGGSAMAVSAPSSGRPSRALGHGASRRRIRRAWPHLTRERSATRRLTSVMWPWHWMVRGPSFKSPWPCCARSCGCSGSTCSSRERGRVA